MPTRFAGALCIISGLMRISRRKLQTPRSTSSKQDRLCRLPFRRLLRVVLQLPHLRRLRGLRQRHGASQYPELAPPRRLVQARNKLARGIATQAMSFGCWLEAEAATAPNLIACPSRIATGPLSFGRSPRRLRTVRIARYWLSFPCGKPCNARAPTTPESAPRYPW